MSGPPKTIDAADLWQQLQAMPRPGREVDFPRNDEHGEPIGQVWIQVLTQAELMASAAAAEKRTRRLLRAELEADVKKDERSAGYEDIYNNASTLEVLFRAVRRIGAEPGEAPSLFFPSVESIAQKLTQDEVGALMRSYLIVQAELGPIVATMGPGEMDQWVRRLVEGASAAPLALLSSDALEALVMRMASALYPSLTGTSSSGSPPDASPTTPESPPSMSEKSSDG